MTDPTFGDIEFRGDTWDGLVRVDFATAGTSAFAVHVWADESGPTIVQRSTFEQLKARYPDLWPNILAALLDLHPGLSTLEEVEMNLSPIVGCYIELDDGVGPAEFELVYGFELEGEDDRGFFIRFVDWQIVEAVIAE